VGIDGFSSNSVEQLGTEEDVVGGVPQYSAWYEIYPAYPVTINMTINPGDTVSASVVYETSGQYKGEFQLSITDGSQSFVTYQGYAQAQRSSAEWIVEAPSSNSGVLPLANFGTVAFTNASATIDGTTGPINDSAWRAAAINMSTGSGLEDSTSGLTNTGTTSAFTVTYNTSANSANAGSSQRTGYFSPLQTAAVSAAVPGTQYGLPAASQYEQQARDRLFASLDFLGL